MSTDMRSAASQAPRPEPAAVLQVFVYGHSALFYWWPLWVAGYVMALLTKLNPDQVVIADKPEVFYPSRNLGVIYTLLFLLMIVITSTRVRGMAAALIIACLSFLALLFAYLDWWPRILDWVGHQSIYMNLGFYLTSSTLLLVLWLVSNDTTRGGREAMSQATHFDAIIIGTGAGGGTLAYHLAPSGKRILILERGDYLPRERDNWSSTAVFIDDKYRAKETWLDKEGKTFHPGIQYYVGGDTKVYGAALFRLRKEDFGEIAYKDGVSPAWPVSYEDFEPYYTQAEHLYHVHGRHGSDPTEPFASRPYPHPPVSNEPRIQQLHDDLVRLGHHPFPLPLGILLDEDNGKVAHASRCIRCDRFDGFPCLVHGKADAEVLCVTPALEHKNVRLLTNACVERLETSPSGRAVTKVHVRHNGAPEEYSADIVVVACGAINSAALLLRSANDRHPRGLANSSDVVGRNYMRHNCSAFMAISVSPNPTVFQKTLALNDFYFRSGDDDWSYPLGEIQLLGKTDGEIIKGELSGWKSWTPIMALDAITHHSLDFWLQTEDLPKPDNRVTLDAKGSIKLSLTDTNLEGHQRLIAKLKGMLKNIGCHDHLLPRTLYLSHKIPIGGTAHQNGTICFGRDPKTSALDLNCKAHDVDNLYVVDGSFFVSCGSVNPALTIIANALRVGDHLLERLGGKGFSYPDA